MDSIYERITNAADQLAVDSRKNTVGCVELKDRIEKTILQFAKEVREETVRRCAEITRKNPVPDYHSNEARLLRIVEQKILALLKDNSGPK